MKRLHFIIPAVSLAVAFTACSDDDSYFNNIAPDKYSDICFGVSVSSDWNEISRSSFSSRQIVNDVLTLTDSQNGDTLYLYSEISDFPVKSSVISRGQAVSADDGTMYDEIAVSAYHYEDNVSWSDFIKTAPNFFYDETASDQGNLFFRSNPPRYWPKSGKVRFLAYAPSADEATAIPSQLESQVPRNYWFDKDYANGPRIYIRIPNDAKDQQDLLVAYSDEITCQGEHTPVPVKFQHPLTGIKFECSEDMIDCTIKKITLKNIRRDGNFVFNMDDAKSPRALSLSDIESYPETASPKYEIWGNLDDFSLTFDGGGKPVGANKTVTAEDSMFFMLPQTFDTAQWPWEGKDVTLEIELEHINVDTGEPVTQIVSTSLAGRTWPAGKIVTYRLSFKDQILEAEQPDFFTYLGYVFHGDTLGTKDNTIAVTSINSDKFRDWSFEILGDGANWLTATKAAGGDSLTLRVIDSSITYKPIDIDARLNAAAAKGSASSPWNLSNSSGASSVQNTANCYMVDAAGTYIIPLVFGNAVKNGEKNQIAYYLWGADLAQFNDYKGFGIWTQYIQKNNSYTLGNASLLWQDSQNLVTNVTRVDNFLTDAQTGEAVPAIRFEVPKSNIKQGNAVIAITDSNGVIMWSWHIWVTNLDFSDTIAGFEKTIPVVTTDKSDYNLMPVNLGWCSNGDAVKYYPERTCTVRLSSGTLTKDIKVVQKQHLAYPRGNHTYYQWGRKDPFVGTNDGVNSKQWWNAQGVSDATQTELTLIPGNPTTETVLTELIKNPDKWHIPPYTEPGIIKWGGIIDKKDSKDVTYSNLWINTEGSTDYKTIYDPCPVGYRVSDANAFTGLKIIDFLDNNAEFAANYALFNEGVQILTFPLSGYRDWADNGRFWSYKEGARGCVWSNKAKPDSEAKAFNGSQGCAYYMNFNTNVMIAQDFYYTCDGFAVRPMTE